MIIVRKLQFRGSKKDREFEALFDTGASISCIRPEKAKGLGFIEKLREPLFAGVANGEKIEINQRILLEFFLDNIRMEDIFYLFPNLKREVIIGVYTMQKWHIILDPKKGKIITNPLVAEVWV